MNNIALKLTISGRVQGVGYRYNALHIAKELTLSGWVRNVYNGDVEVFVEGNEEKVNKFIVWCRKGTVMAKVINVNIDKYPYSGEFKGFEIRS